MTLSVEAAMSESRLESKYRFRPRTNGVEPSRGKSVTISQPSLAFFRRKDTTACSSGAKAHPPDARNFRHLDEDSSRGRRWKVVPSFDFDARKYLLLTASIEAFSLGHDRSAGTVGRIESDESKLDQPKPSLETLIVPSFELTVRGAALWTVPISENLLARISICTEFSLGKSR